VQKDYLQLFLGKKDRKEEERGNLVYNSAFPPLDGVGIYFLTCAEGIPAAVSG
jgi:hypothetical protein